MTFTYLDAMSTDPTPFAGRVALVTGSSRGLGAATRPSTLVTLTTIP